MSRFWLGVILLLVLLALCLGVTWGIRQLVQPVQALLRQAGDAALAGSWQQAQELAEQARQLWQRNWPLCAAVSDHAPMEQIDSLFFQIPALAHLQEQVRFSTLCAQLSSLVEAIADAHSLHWWTLF